VTRKPLPPRAIWALGAAVAVGVIVASWFTGKATPGVAATLFLGVATVWLGWGARQSIRQAAHFRVADRRERREAALRAALLEQLDECRLWVGHPPQPGAPASNELGWTTPPFEFVRALLRSEEVDPECRARLLWRIGQLTASARGRQARLNADIGGGPVGGPLPWHDIWPREVDLRQEMVGLLLGAAAQCGFDGLVASFREDPWIEPIAGPILRVHTETQEVTQAHLPPWPSDPAYAPWSPQAQDERAHLLEMAKRNRINEARQQGSNPGEGTDGLVSTPPRTLDL